MALISWDHEGEATAPNSIHLQQLKYRLSRIFMLECFCANQVLCRKWGVEVLPGMGWVGKVLEKQL